MSGFLDALQSGRVLLMDGAMGTELQRVGLEPNENTAAWNLLHPDRVRAVHQAYLAAGSEVLLSNTFAINDPSLFATMRAAGRSSTDLQQLWQASHDVMDGDARAAYRIAALGPIAGVASDREFNLMGCFWTNSRIFRPFDAVLLETCSSPRVRYAIGAIRRDTNHPILLSLTYQRNSSGKLLSFSGHPPEWFAERAKRYGADALGVNCGREMDMGDMIEIVRRYGAVTDLPMFVRPNAGTPTKQGKDGIYPQTPEMMAARLPELLATGVSMFGGCCGTTPRHIAAFRKVIDVWNAQNIK